MCLHGRPRRGKLIVYLAAGMVSACLLPGTAARVSITSPYTQRPGIQEPGKPAENGAEHIEALIKAGLSFVPRQWEEADRLFAYTNI
jgi:hypothetical protein